MLAAGLEKELVQELQQWSSDTLVSLYNDNTAKDRDWKGLGKLKSALETDFSSDKPESTTDEQSHSEGV